ncbi:MAG: hypothetical protein ABI661_01760 [Gammaproteobacteria bacterium]
MATKQKSNAVTWAALVIYAVLATGCEKKGPVEQVGEEVDEAVDTMKNGKESTANKLDDAVDEIRDK